MDKVSFSGLETALKIVITHFLWRQIGLISRIERKLVAAMTHLLAKGKIISAG